MRKLFSWIPNFWESRLATLGVAITTVAGCAILLAIAVEIATPGLGVYTAAFLFLIVPAFFILGLLMIPLGMYLHRRKQAQAEEAEPGPFEALVQNKTARRNLVFLALMTGVNVLLLGAVGHQAISYMESPQFCGTVCHSVMEPEYVAYLNSPHSRVACVDCHIGPGASWAVKSKIDGIRQVWHTIFGTYNRPIPAPVHHLRPARETCEECHQPEKFHGSRVFYRVHYRDDRENSPEANVLAIKVGGRNVKTGVYEGIHWHVSRDVEIRYEALDEKREKIGRVMVVRDGEVVKEFLPPDDVEGEVHEIRTMDCVDCHNRPTHRYDGSADQAIDHAFRSGLLDPSVPWLHKVALPLLQQEERDRDTAQATFRAELEAGYRESYPDDLPEAQVLDEAAEGLATLYRRNIYPRMDIGWDTYPTHIGHQGEHQDVRGCFRCHNEEHETADGEAISQDCELCHQMLAMEEDPEELEDEIKALIFGE